MSNVGSAKQSSRSTPRQLASARSQRSLSKITNRKQLSRRKALPLLREKSKLEALRLKREKRELLAKMIQFAETQERKISKRFSASQNTHSKLCNKEVANYRRGRLLKQLKIVKDFAMRKIPNPSHFKNVEQLYVDCNLPSSRTIQNTINTKRSTSSARSGQSSTLRTCPKFDEETISSSLSRKYCCIYNDVHNLWNRYKLNVGDLL